jgi:MFS family permease
MRTARIPETARVTETPDIVLEVGPGAEGRKAWPSRKVAYYALAILLVAYVFSFVDRIILSMLVGPIKAELGLSDTQIALVNGLAFSMFYATMGLPLGWLVDRTSRKGVIAVGVALWSLVTAASGLARDFSHLFLARMGVGVGEAALSPGAYSMIADYFPPKSRGRAIAIYTMGVSLGSGLAYLIGGFLISFANKHAAIHLPLLGALTPWRFIFIAVGLPGLLVALAMLTVPEPARRREVGDVETGPTEAFWAFLKRRWAVVAAYVFGYGMTNVPFAAFLAWGPAFMGRHYHLSPKQIGLALGLIFLGPACLGQWVGAAVTDRRYAAGKLDAPFQTGLVCAVLLIPFAALITLAPTASVSLAALAVSVFLVCASVGHQATVATLISPNRLRGQVSAFYILIQGVIGAAVVPLAVALISDHVLHDSSKIGVAMAIVGVVGAVIGAVVLALGLKPLRLALTPSASNP